ncbi:MAG: hypothetical protein ACK52P_21405 [Alphaproteobacteria bacterium]
MQPRPADHRGSLTPASAVAEVLPNKTLVISQPWVGLNRYELRENVIYFAGDGEAYSRDWSGIRWRTQDNQICLLRPNAVNCYSAFSDSSGQAFVRDDRTGLLARVTRIEPGDSRNLRAEHLRRLEDQQRWTELTMLFAGMLFEALLTAPRSSASRGADPKDYPMCPYAHFFDSVTRRCKHIRDCC